MKRARKIYYDLATGNKILEIGESEGSLRETTLDEDFISFKELSERVKSTVGVIQLNYGQYADKFGVYYYNIVGGAIVWGELIDVNNPPVVIQPTNKEVMDMQMTVMDLVVTVLESQMGGIIE